MKDSTTVVYPYHIVSFCIKKKKKCGSTLDWKTQEKSKPNGQSCQPNHCKNKAVVAYIIHTLIKTSNEILYFK